MEYTEKLLQARVQRLETRIQELRLGRRVLMNLLLQETQQRGNPPWPGEMVYDLARERSRRRKRSVLTQDENKR